MSLEHVKYTFEGQTYLIAVDSEQADWFRERLKGQSNFQRVQDFHRAFGVPSAEKPTEPSRDLYHLRVGLIDEELSEFVEAHYEDMREDADFKPDLIEIADAIGDMLYVIYGTADQYGLDADAIFEAIHVSNMSKLDENGKPLFHDGITGPKGKVKKSARFEEPKLREVIYGDDSICVKETCPENS